MTTPRTNPLLSYTDGFPPFSTTLPEDFGPALAQTTAQHKAEIDAIASQSEPATFENTVVALDRSGWQYGLVSRMFWNLTSSETSEALQAVERDWAPKLAAHGAAIFLNDALFAMVDKLYNQRFDLGLDSEDLRLLERVHLDFVRAGARLKGAAKERYAQIVEESAALHTTFSQNVLGAEGAWTLPLNTEEDFAGLPDFVRSMAASAAQQRGLAHKGVVTLSRSLVVPFLTFSTRRDLREIAYEAWVGRGGAESHNNWPIAQKILALRQELAELHGLPNYAHYQLADTMAGKPEAVQSLLDKVWVPAKRLAAREADALKAMASSLGQPADRIAAWDWRFFAEKVRVARYALDDAQIKPYFSLDRMTQAMFDVAGRLFGIEFRVNSSYCPYVSDVVCYDVYSISSGQAVGIFMADNFARPSKRGGAWMSDYRSQRGRGPGSVLPIIVNNNNFAKAPEGQPTLLSADDVRTLFHEFGHGLHGLLSQVKHERLAGTNVLRDFVELPSQLMEHWAFTPEVLKKHARHIETGEPIPDDLMAKLKAAKRFNQGFEAIEYTASALVDLALHQRTDGGTLDLAQFQTDTLAALGMPEGIRMRHHLQHFSHLFSGDGYASAYYVYLWAETLDADAFEAFEESGNIFAPEVAERLHQHVYSAGNAVEPSATYRAFRGKNPDVTAMLRKKGLLEEATPA